MQSEPHRAVREEDALSLIRAFLDNPSYKTLTDLSLSALPADIAEAVNALPSEERRRLLFLLPNELVADVFQEFDIPTQIELLDVLGDEKAAGVVSEMESDDAADLLGELKDEDKESILAGLEDGAEQVKSLLEYEEDSSGGIMATEYVSLNVKWNVQQAFDELRRVCPDADKTYYVYVVDDERRLLGVLSLRDLVMADRMDPIESIMSTNVLSVKVESDQEEAAHIFKKYGFLSLPVVDDHNRLTGIISANDIILVMDEETTEDIQKMSASLPLEGSYLSTGMKELWVKRVGWLLALFITGAFTSNIMRGNEAILGQFVTLVFFIPMLIDEGGNAGSQSSAVIIRSLALREFDTGEYLKVIWKEVRISVMLGLTIGGLGFIASSIMSSEGLFWAKAGIIVGTSTLIVVTFGAVLGSILPLLAHVAGFDPAVLAGPVITTIVDSFGLIIYFAIAKTILGI